MKTACNRRARLFYGALRHDFPVRCNTDRAFRIQPCKRRHVYHVPSTAVPIAKLSVQTIDLYSTRRYNLSFTGVFPPPPLRSGSLVIFPLVRMGSSPAIVVVVTVVVVAVGSPPGMISRSSCFVPSHPPSYSSVVGFAAAASPPPAIVPNPPVAPRSQPSPPYRIFALRPPSPRACVLGSVSS